MVYNEAHALKNTNTLTHLAIKYLAADKIWFVSATPMINHVRDLTGYLSLLWKEEWLVEPHDTDLASFYTDGLDEEVLLSTLQAETIPRADLITAVTRGQNIYQLNPDIYRSVATGEIETELVSAALRAILSQLQLRHTMATEIDLEDGTPPLRIGANIPHYRVVTVELAMSRSQGILYQRIFHHHSSELYTGPVDPEVNRDNVAEVETRAKLNMMAHRRLVHATQNPHLEALVDHIGKKSLVKDINKWYHKADDFGVTHFFRHTRPAPYLQPYQDRLAMAEYMAGPSVKIQYLCGLLHRFCIVEKQRVQVVVDMPMNQWYVVLNNCSYHTQVNLCL